MEVTECGFFEVVLKQVGCEFAIFDSGLMLVNASSGLDRRMLGDQGDTNSNICLTDLFPELGGMEEIIQRLIQTKERMDIPRINYSGKKYSYVDIAIESISDQLLLVWHDTSSSGNLEQRIVQQRNEMALLNRKLEKSYRILGDLSGVDEVTKLLTRRAATHIFEHRIEQARRKGFPLSTFFIDLDGFKGINDNYGHAAGDEVLGFVGRVMRSIARSEDTVARWGGDEFVVLSSDMETKGEDRIVASLLSVFEREACVLSESGSKIFIQISIGVCHINPDALNVVGLDEMVKVADRAMYEAKVLSGNSATFFEIDEFGKLHRFS